MTQLRSHDIAVSALADMLGVAWNTVWHALAPVIEGQLAAGDQLAGVNALGVDEHVWRHVGAPGAGLVTAIVDYSRSEDGRPQARLLDLIKGRTGVAYGDAIRDELPEAITVLDAFHLVKLGGQVVVEVRRRLQQDTLGYRGRAGEPLYGIRRTL
ncbi:transposase [Kocuria sp. CCUG 69068]|uniref:transposase n=1 Tax=Kocuria sp. CCUG 69068 TaxID=2043138 RepID=UPI00210570E3